MRSRWPPPRDRVRPDVVLRLAVRTFSEVCLTAGTLIVLFVAYVLLWTGVKADRAADGEMARLRDGWAAAAPQAAPAAAPGAAPPPAGSAAPQEPRYAPGRAFAEMYVPRFGPDWVRPVLEGTDAELLKKGLGHYAAPTEIPSRTSRSCARGTR